MKQAFYLFLTGIFTSCGYCDYMSEDHKFFGVEISQENKHVLYDQVLVFKPFYTYLSSIQHIPLSYGHDQVWIELTDSLGGKDTLCVSYQINPYYNETCGHRGAYAEQLKITYSTLPSSYQMLVAAYAY